MARVRESRAALGFGQPAYVVGVTVGENYHIDLRPLDSDLLEAGPEKTRCGRDSGADPRIDQDLVAAGIDVGTDIRNRERLGVDVALPQQLGPLRLVQMWKKNFGRVVENAVSNRRNLKRAYFKTMNHGCSLNSIRSELGSIIAHRSKIQRE